MIMRVLILNVQLYINEAQYNLDMVASCMSSPGRQDPR